MITIDGIVYSNVVWRSFTPVAVSISHRTGAATIPLWKLTPDLQAHFGYDPQKAATYAEAQRNAEIARQESLRKTRAEEAERQRHAAEITATNQPVEVEARKTAQENAVHYGPLTQLRFSYAQRLEQMANGNYRANLYYSDAITGAEGNMYVELPPEGYNFINHCVPAGVNGYAVYGRPYTTQLHTLYFGGDVSGAQYTGTAYWLVGVNVNTYTGSISW